jgi:hypothetical protein
MMMRWSMMPLILSFSLAGCLWATDADSDSMAFASCAEDLQLPRDVPPTSAPGMDRPITVKIVPDAAGRLGSISMEGGSIAAKGLVKSWMSSSTFAKRCAGRELVIQFSFVTEGPPIEYPFIWVTFQGPNHFIIHMRTRRPTTFRLPTDAQKDKR